MLSVDDRVPRRLVLFLPVVLVPLFSGCAGDNSSGDDPYEVQRATVEQLLQMDSIAGYKAGLTSERSQSFFGVSEPAAGVLLASGSLDRGATLYLTGDRRLAAEPEIGFIAGTLIRERIQFKDELKTLFSAIVPVVEIPFDSTGVTVPMMIGSNMDMNRFIAGVPQSTLADVNTVEAILLKDGVQVCSGVGSDSMGDQWEALLWLVNRTIESGWTIRPGDLLITGALCAMIPAEPGDYSADFGDFGRIDFHIRSD